MRASADGDDLGMVVHTRRGLARMPRWREWLFAWMARREYAEWQAFGIPADRVTVIDVRVVRD
jgi:K+ transporter